MNNLEGKSLSPDNHATEEDLPFTTDYYFRNQDDVEASRRFLDPEGYKRLLEYVEARGDVLSIDEKEDGFMYMKVKRALGKKAYKITVLPGGGGKCRQEDITEYEKLELPIEKPSERERPSDQELGPDPYVAEVGPPSPPEEVVVEKPKEPSERKKRVKQIPQKIVDECHKYAEAEADKTGQSHDYWFKRKFKELTSCNYEDEGKFAIVDE